MAPARSRITAPTKHRALESRALESRNCCSHLFLTQPNPIRSGPAAAVGEQAAQAEDVGAPGEQGPPEELAERERGALPAEQAQAQDAARLAQQARAQEPRPEPPLRAISISIRPTTSPAPSFRHFRRQ